MIRQSCILLSRQLAMPLRPLWQARRTKFGSEQAKTNKNTKREMDQCVRRFREFLVESPRRETCDIGDIPAKELNVLIGEFLIDLKKTDGSDYEPDSLTSVHHSIALYLQTIGYEYDIVKSSVFHTIESIKTTSIGNC